MSRNNRGLLILLVVLVLVSLIGPLLVGGMMGQGMMWGYGPRGGPSGAGGWAWGLTMGLGLLSMLAFFGALIVGIVLLVRWLGGTTAGPDGRSEDPALETLRRRYAAGEISHEEYERMRKVLER
jgi:putative membrane protein